MNPQQPSSETWMKPRKLLRPAALALALKIAKFFPFVRMRLNQPSEFFPRFSAASEDVPRCHCFRGCPEGIENSVLLLSHVSRDAILRRLHLSS